MRVHFQGKRSAVFSSTCWGLIAAAKDPVSPLTRDSLAELCATYWYPIYAYIRRVGHGPELAEDLTQEFFARLLEPGALDSVDPQKGRFRAFLLVVCNHMLSNRRDYERALKRGGGRRPIPIDLLNAEGRYRLEPSHELTPERLFEHRWALTLLDRVQDRLAAELGRSSKAALFHAIWTRLLGKPNAESYRDLAAALNLSEMAVKKAAQRIRGRFRELVREEVARTLDDPAEIDDEILALRAAVAG
jgi:RNA polymerase sigma-70 factor (ECF subfamily)